MTQPQRYEVGDSKLVCKLTKALHGLKQASWAWYTKLTIALHSLGFQSTKSNVSLLTRVTPSSITYILIYVDDIIVTSSDSSYITDSVCQLNKSFCLKRHRAASLLPWNRSYSHFLR